MTSIATRMCRRGPLKLFKKKPMQLGNHAMPIFYPDKTHTSIQNWQVQVFLLCHVLAHILASSIQFVLIWWLANLKFRFEFLGRLWTECRGWCYQQSYTFQVCTINIWKKLLSPAIWADKNGLVSGRIACISSKNLRSETI